MSRREVISIGFVSTLLVSNVLATKLVSIGNLILPAAVVIYPFCFMLGDILTEVWGYAHAKRVIIAGFAANALLTLFTYIGQVLPPAPFWQHQEAYESIFGMVPRVVLGSFIAYLVGELINSWVLEKIRSLTGPRFLFVRTIGSTVVGQLFDTVIFITIAFAGLVPNAALINLLVGQYVMKVAIEALGGTPLAYVLINWARSGRVSDDVEFSRGLQA